MNEYNTVLMNELINSICKHLPVYKQVINT